MGKKKVLISILGIANFSATKERDFFLLFFLGKCNKAHES